MITLEKIKKWNYLHAQLMLLAGVSTVYFQKTSILLLVVLLSFIRFTALHLSKARFIGYANLITLFRFCLLIFLGFSLFKMAPWMALLIGIIILILDGIDGFFARRFKESSNFGAYLDMEADTFFVCLFCTFYYLENLFGGWILLIGFMRYLYVSLILIFKLEGIKEKSTRFAKTIAVVLFSSVLMPLVLPQWIYYPSMILAAVLVVYSFGLSFWGMLGERNEGEQSGTLRNIGNGVGIS